MSTEAEIFERYRIDFDKLAPFGFWEEKDEFIYEKSFMDEQFRAIVKISKTSKI